MQFVFDLDGTICFKGQPVSETILSSLEGLTRQGHEVIFASARPIRDMLPVIHPRFHHYTLIGGNGSLISKDSKTTVLGLFETEKLQEIYRYIEEHEATYLMDSEWDYAYTGPADHPILQNVDPSKLARQVSFHLLPSVVKILITTAIDNYGLESKLRNLGAVVHRHKNEEVIDVSPAGVHKWNALQRLGVKEKRFIAFGNDTNDIPMFRNALHSVMIGHHAELAAYAAEAISLEGDVEQNIVEKINDLGEMWQNAEQADMNAASQFILNESE